VTTQKNSRRGVQRDAGPKQNAKPCEEELNSEIESVHRWKHATAGYSPMQQ
jgi:hypothetical protein